MQEDGFEELISDCEMIKYILCAFYFPFSFYFFSQMEMAWLSYQERNLQIVIVCLEYYLLCDHQKSAESLQYNLFEWTFLLNMASI